MGVGYIYCDVLLITVGINTIFQVKFMYHSPYVILGTSCYELMDLICWKHCLIFSDVA
jgi:hypothetical protein